MSDEEEKLIESESQKPRARFISVEPVYGLIVAIQGATVTGRVQYIEKRLEQQYNHTLQGGNCSFENATADVTGIRIQSETALWDMWMASITTTIPILAAPLLVAASDVVGRKPLLIMAALNHLISAIIIMVVAFFNLSLWVMVIAKIVLGVFGDAAMPNAVCLAYIGDSVERDKRAVKMATLDAATLFGWGLGKLLTNLIIQETSSFTFAFGFPVVLAMVCLFYITCPGILLETINRAESHQNQKLNVKGVFSGTAHSLRTLFGPEIADVRWRIGILLAIKALLYIVKEGVYTVGTIIGLGKPFCWPPLTIGIYEALTSFLPGITAFLLTSPLLACFNEYWLLHLGTLSFIGQVTTSALAKNTFQLAYLGSFIGVFRTLPLIMVKYLLSDHVSSDQQGSVFAAFSFVVSIAKASSPFIVNGIFSFTVTVGCPRFVFYMWIGLLGCVILCNGLLQLITLKKNEQEEDNLELMPMK